MPNSLASNAVPDFSEAGPPRSVAEVPNVDLYNELQRKAAERRIALGQGSWQDYLLKGQGVAKEFGNNLVNSAVKAVSAPADALSGRLPMQDPITGHTNPEAIGRAADLTMLASGATLAAPAEEGLAMGSGAMKRGAMSAVEEAPKDAGPAPVFYSAVERAVAANPTKAASGDQWLATLKNAPGVKGEEIEHLGLEGKLAGKAKVSKDEIGKLIKDNKVRLEEHWKGGEDPEIQIQVRAEQLAEQHGGEPEDYYEEADNELRGGVGGGGSLPKFSEYQLPGGDNYKEMLMTLPQKGSGPREVYGYPIHAPTENAVTDYYSSHWDEPNVLAHVRMNDRELPDASGTPQHTLFLEELQSDWHQAGRKQGYQGPDAKSEIKRLNQLQEGIRQRQTNILATEKTRTPEFLRLEDEYDKLREKINQVSSTDYSGVPDAPFKRSWPQLLLHRMVRHAAENGYDQVAWTDGATQAERYDLSKHIDALDWDKAPHIPGSKVSITPWKGGKNLGRIDVEPGKLADHVGKDMAEKILKEENNKGSYRGLDLKVGGEGMRGFYDDMLPKIANKAFGKLGGKVKQQEISTAPEGPRPEMGDTPREQEMHDMVIERIRQDFHRDYPGREAEFPRFLDSTQGRQLYDQYDAMGWQRLKKEAEKGPKVTKTIHVLPITPEMRHHALTRGFPLFSSGVPVPDGSSVEPYQRDKVVPGVKLTPVNHQPEF